MNKIVELLPEMKAGDALISALSVLPEYDENIHSQNEALRLIALSDLYKIYIPSPMTTEIYSKLYLALLRSLLLHSYIAPTIKQRKQTTAQKKQKAAPKAECSDITDNFSIARLAATAKANSSDIVELLKAHLTIEEVRI